MAEESWRHVRVDWAGNDFVVVWIWIIVCFAIVTLFPNLTPTHRENAAGARLRAGVACERGNSPTAMATGSAPTCRRTRLAVGNIARAAVRRRHPWLGSSE